MKIRIGSTSPTAHQAACADETGKILWSGHRFRTSAVDLEALWNRIPENQEVMVVMDPTRYAWVPLAAWFRRRGAQVVVVPSEQASDLRDYYAKHAKTDRLDAQLLARLPVLHAEGFHLEHGIGPGDPLKRAVKMIQSGAPTYHLDAPPRLSVGNPGPGVGGGSGLGHDPNRVPVPVSVG